MGAPKITSDRRRKLLVLRSIWSYFESLEILDVPHSGQHVYRWRSARRQYQMLSQLVHFSLARLKTRSKNVRGRRLPAAPQPGQVNISD